MKRNLFDKITEEKIRSKTTDQAMAKTFRLDRLDQIAEQTKLSPEGEYNSAQKWAEMEVLIMRQK